MQSVVYSFDLCVWNVQILVCDMLWFRIFSEKTGIDANWWEYVEITGTKSIILDFEANVTLITQRIRI